MFGRPFGRWVGSVRRRLPCNERLRKKKKKRTIPTPGNRFIGVFIDEI